jgi:hypothetical protein
MCRVLRLALVSPDDAGAGLVQGVHDCPAEARGAAGDQRARPFQNHNVPLAGLSRPPIIGAAQKPGIGQVTDVLLDRM